MRTKKVNRYWCDYCNKAALAKSAMTRHESSCTKNPERVCKACRLFDNTQASMADMLALLPALEASHPSGIDYGENARNLVDAVKTALPALREASGNCPACIMAALRVKGIPVPMAEEFDFSAEMKELLANWNDSQRGHRYDY